ncbi:Uncharacterised protein [Vibrio cholerae]|nr:Uncharacterised protein [Vibrio cholerae]CSI03669.1 Uncharacterised protein [Vibrio cholerae]
MLHQSLITVVVHRRNVAFNVSRKIGERSWQDIWVLS